MSCDGSPSKAGGGCGCSSCASTSAAAGIPAPVRIGRGRARSAGPGARPNPPAPIGTRPSAPGEPAFNLPFLVVKEPVPLGSLLDELFPDATARDEDSAEGYFRSIDPRHWLVVRDYLLTIPTEFRLDALMGVSQKGGFIPDPEGRVHIAVAGFGSAPVADRPPTPPPFYGYAPPPSVPVCIVNGFDPRWGTPPSSYLGVALSFDASTGAYAFDRSYALLNSKNPLTGQPSYTNFDFDRIEASYAQRFGVQPFRRTVSSPWEFRWIPLLVNPVVNCV